MSWDGEFAQQLPGSLAERLQASPIHQWIETAGIEVSPEYSTTDIQEFLDYVELQTSMSPDLRVPIHELLLLRGAYPPRMTEEQRGEFEDRRENLMNQLEVGPFEARWMRDMFLPIVVDQWTQYCDDNPPLDDEWQ